MLLIVGGHDEIVIELNREARSLLRAPSELAIVPGATHLFEEPGSARGGLATRGRLVRAPPHPRRGAQRMTADGTVNPNCTPRGRRSSDEP